jgi:hypothetical protein
MGKKRGGRERGKGKKEKRSFREKRQTG